MIPETKTLHIKTYRRMLKAILFIIAKNWKQPKCSSIDVWTKYLYLFGHKKEWSTDIFNNMNESWKY
jgi:hypothetical protein